jgi:hypothetical protein
MLNYFSNAPLGVLRNGYPGNEQPGQAAKRWVEKRELGN